MRRCARCAPRRLQQRPAGLFAHAQHLRRLGRPPARRRGSATGRGTRRRPGNSAISLGRHLQRQPRLAEAAHAQQRDQARAGQQLLDLVELALAADEATWPAAAGCSGSRAPAASARRRAPRGRPSRRRAAARTRRRRRRPRTAPAARPRPSAPSGRATAALQRLRSSPSAARASAVSSVWPPRASDITRAAVGLARPSTSSGLAPRATSSARVLAQDHRPHVQAGARAQRHRQRRQRAVVGQRVLRGVGGAARTAAACRRSCRSRARASGGSRSRATRSCAAHTAAIAASPRRSDSWVLSTTSVSSSARSSLIGRVMLLCAIVAIRRTVVHHQGSMKPRRGGSARPSVAGQHAQQPGARVGGVDHGVDLQVAGHVQRLPAFHRGRQQAVEQGLALGLGRSGEFLAEAQPHRAFEPHRAELAAGPGAGGHRRVEVAGGQRHRAQAVAAAQHHAGHRHAQRRGGDEQPRGVAHHRGLLATPGRP